MFAERLRDRQAEIEEAVVPRVFGVSDETERVDPEYVDGLRTAISVALDYGIEALERDSERPAPVPIPLLAQARLAARSGVSLDKVLRRYFVGYALLGDFVVAEAEIEGASGRASIKRHLRIQAGVFDHLIGAVIEEYWKDAGSRRASIDQRQADLVQRLLDGEMLDAPDLGYGFDRWHQALIAWGADAPDVVNELAKHLDRQRLLIRPDDRSVWAWLGGREPLCAGDLTCAVADGRLGNASLAIGESGVGLAGWRTSFRQARAALPIALRSGRRVTRYGDVALVASIARDDLLSSSLRDTYLAPLDSERDGGSILRLTLRAYIGTGRNVSSAAAMLRVNRHTIANRLRTVEERIGRTLDGCITEIDAALRLEELGGQMLSYRGDFVSQTDRAQEAH